MTSIRKFTDRWAIKYPEKPDFRDVNWDKYRQFKNNWVFSSAKLCEINNKLNCEFNEDSNFSVLVAGSYGRMDAHDKSDLDFLIVHNGHLIDGTSKVDKVRECASALNISLPNPEGAFSKPIALKNMIDSTGRRDDDLISTAQRLLILMECRPIYNEIFYKTIVNEILDHYLRLVYEEKEKEALVLLNDLIKYFRYICLNVEFSFWQEETKWGLRNIKLRHSRILIYAGLLFLILNSSKYRSDKISYLRDNIHFTPMEKIYKVYHDNKDYNFERIISAYNNFLYKLVSDDVRNELKQMDYSERYNYNCYSELKANSDFLQAELTRFILDNKMHWTSKIFEYLVF